ncbi:hypothetical protein JCM8115_003351 [Rhodotorula mucilaginosa]
MPPSLLDYLCSALQKNLAGSHPRLALTVLRSDPQRSHALFPHATTAKSTTKVYHEDIFVVLSQPADSMGGSSAAAVPVPVGAIEAALYTVPATGTALLYISKVDTTGLLSGPTSTQPSPSPTRPLVAAFLSYFLSHPPHHCSRVRIHVFARAQSQYLFPGSADNTAKKLLDDKALLRWWKRTLERAVVESTISSAQSTTTTKLFYLIPGLAYLESLPYVPANGTLEWTYSHPYATLSSPLHPATDPPSSHPLVDHIPAFPDDPKSRFLHSLTSSSVAPSGTEGDYDDVFLSLASNSFTTGQTPAQKVAETERAIERERRRLVEGVPGGVDEWWERMAFRQECCAGQLVGFFVVAAGEPAAAEPPASATSTSTTSTSHPAAAITSSHGKSGPPKRHPLSLRPSTYTKLWSQLHNYDYTLPALSKLVEAVSKWEQGLERALRAEEDLDDGTATPGEEGLQAPEEEDTIGAAAETAAVNGEEKGDVAQREQEQEHGTRDEAKEREWRRRYEKFVRREIKVDNPHLATPATTTTTVTNGNENGDGSTAGEQGTTQKRAADDEQQAPPKVNVLAPRKKKKLAVAVAANPDSVVAPPP